MSVLLFIPYCFLTLHISYLLLCNKSLQNLVAKTKSILFAHDSMVSSLEWARQGDPFDEFVWGHSRGYGHLEY